MRLDPFETEDRGPPGATWLETTHRPTETAFVAAFTADAVLDAGVLPHTVAGPLAIRRIIEATKSLYDSISFTHEDVVCDRTYLHWEGRFEGLPVSGVTILTHAPNGLISSVALYHRPFAQVAAFAAALAQRLESI